MSSQKDWKEPQVYKAGDIIPVFQPGVSFDLKGNHGFETFIGLNPGEHGPVVGVRFQGSSDLAAQAYKVTCMTPLNPDVGYEVNMADADWQTRRPKLETLRPGRIGTREVNVIDNRFFIGLQIKFGVPDSGSSKFRDYCKRFLPHLWKKNFMAESMPEELQDLRLRIIIDDEKFLDATESNQRGIGFREMMYFYPENTGPLALPHNPLAADRLFAKDGLRILVPNDDLIWPRISAQFVPAEEIAGMYPEPVKEEFTGVRITDWLERKRLAANS